MADAMTIDTTRLRALLAEASEPHDWSVATLAGCLRILDTDGGIVATVSEESDARLIVAMREALPGLLNDVDRLREEKGAAFAIGFQEGKEQAYPRALQAAASLVTVESVPKSVLDDAPEVHRWVDETADAILDLTEEQIEAFDAKVEREHAAAVAPKPERAVVYWSCEGDDAECLRHETINEAMDDYLDSAEIDWSDEEATVTATGWARMDVEPYVRHGMEDILEAIDEEMGDPNEKRRVREMITPGMEAAHNALVDAILRDYTPWACEQVTKQEVNVLAWVREHRLHWVPGKPEEGGTR